jgi:parvulin-like peptidyl-prolyl isomerase
VLILLMASPEPAPAQEPELVSEIVARVNNDIITRADYLAALAELKEQMTKHLSQQGKGPAEIEAEYERMRPTVLDVLVENLLLQQKAKELGIEVEAEVNQQMAQIARNNNFKNQIEFENAVRNQGMDPDALRASIRKELQEQYVLQREVLQPIYFGLKDKERREYYEKNKDRFTIPGKVVLSEIFLPLEGHTASEVEQRARRLAAELRAGGSFTDAVLKNSPPNRPSRSQNGKLGEFKPEDLKPEVTAAISTLQVGQVTEPIRFQDGFQIVRLDERKPAVVRNYEDAEVENAVGRMITMERAEEGRKKYLSRLREEAFIKINSAYASAEVKTTRSTGNGSNN